MLTPAERLVVGADIDDALLLAEKLKGTGTVFKENTELRNAGYAQRIQMVHDFGLQYFADVKLTDIENTIRRDGKKLYRLKPEMLSVMLNVSKLALRALREELPETEILGVTLLTDIKETECRKIYRRSIKTTVQFFAIRALEAGLHGVVCAPREIPYVREVAGDALTINTPNVRPRYLPVRNDNQNRNRTLDVVEALGLGATRVVIGRPITEAENPLGATMQIIDEITQASTFL